jgi:oxygen-independent coproporphyrinogen-3 oxidase
MDANAQLPFLLERYGKAAIPRYTSYPPANLWSDVDGDAFAKEFFSRVTRPLALYVHVPFCHKLCFYCGCNMLVTHNEELVERYMRDVDVEFDRVAALVKKGLPVVQLHLGGGTPTYLSSAQLVRLIGGLKRRFDFQPGIEASIEIHPPVTTFEQLETLTSLGFNRLSMGVQDFDPKVQEKVNRIQPFEQTRDLIVHARKLGFQSVNVDLMYGLPLQSVEGFSATLDRIEELKPDRLALFGYAHMPQLKKHQGVFKKEELPTAPTRLELLELGIARLLKAGYVYIGLDHFALPTDELVRARAERSMRRNFMGYTTGAETDMLAFGPSSISEAHGSYAQATHEVHPWAEQVEAGHFAIGKGYTPSEDDHLRREVIMELFCHLEADLEGFAKRHGQQWQEVFGREWVQLAQLERDGLCSRDGSKVKVSQVGQRFVRNVAAVFDATLQQKVGQRHHAASV